MTMRHNAKRPEDVAMEKRIAARIFIWRRRKGISAPELAARSGLHENTILRIENGNGCSATSLAKIADGLCVSIAVLVPKPQHVVAKMTNSLFET
jgi:transcriptional regulator with XRE-family HTH domain